MDASPAGDNQALIDRLLRDAHLHRRRGQLANAELLCRRALELAPEDVTAQEMMGDLLAEKDELDEALELYRKAFEKQPQRAVLEEKIARLVLQKDEEERERIAMQFMLENPRAKAERKRHATIALLLSLICPGLGQLIAGQYVKGTIVLVLGLAAMLFGMPEFFKFMLAFATPNRVGAPNSFLAGLGALGLLVWLYGLLDAAAMAGKPKKDADGW